MPFLHTYIIIMYIFLFIIYYGGIYMMKFSIEVKEVLRKIITIEADSCTEALEKVEDMYQKGDIILDSEDFEGEPEISPLI